MSRTLNTLTDVAATCLAETGMKSDPLLPILSIKAKKRQHRAKNCPYTKEFLEDLYINQQMARKAIASKLNVPIGTLQSWFIGLDIRLPAHLYAKATGGQDRRQLMAKKRIQVETQRVNAHNNSHLRYGYNNVFNPGHPKSTNDGYVAEHRHIIEAQIHRFLEDHEDVHHLNFDSPRVQ